MSIRISNSLMYIYIGIGQHKQKLIMYSAMKEFFSRKRRDCDLDRADMSSHVHENRPRRKQEALYREEEEVKAKGCYSH